MILSSSRHRQGIIVAASLALLTWLWQSRASDPEWRLRVTKSDRDDLAQYVRQIKSDGMAVHRFDNSYQLTPIYFDTANNSSDYQVQSLNALEDSVLVGELQLGNCAQASIARSSSGVKLPSLTCPIFYEGDLAGSISAVYGIMHGMPKPNKCGDYDPTAGVLFKVGDSLGN